MLTEQIPVISMVEFVEAYYVEVMEKINGYVRDSVKRVWLTEPKCKTVKVVTPDYQETTFSNHGAGYPVDG